MHNIFYARFYRTNGDACLTIYISTTNGRAFFYFVNLLKSIKLKYKIEVPKQSMDIKGLYLTTDCEKCNDLTSITFEELSKDEILDKIKIFQCLYSRKNIQLGIDPGYRIGIAVTIENRPVHMDIMNNTQEVIGLVSRLSAAELGNLDIKIGDGRPEITQKIIDGLRPIVKSHDLIQVVNEKRTTPKGRARVKKDMVAAYHIAMKRGLTI